MSEAFMSIMWWKRSSMPAAAPPTESTETPGVGAGGETIVGAGVTITGGGVTMGGMDTPSIPSPVMATEGGPGLLRALLAGPPLPFLSLLAEPAARTIRTS
jgi:hypothetical protein